MKTVLVTGASGFIGRHVLPLLRASGWSVHGVAPSGGNELDTDTIWHRVDLLEGDAARALVADVKPQCLLHLAWIATPGVYWTSPENERWMAASLTLVEAFRKAGGQRVVAAGTCAEYAWGSDDPCREDHTPLAPATAYGKAKLELFRRLSAWSEANRTEFAWGRVFHVYGPHEHPRRLVPAVILSLLQGGEARTTTGHQVRGFLHVADVAAAFSRLVDSDMAGAVNVGSADPVTLAEIVGRIADLLGARDRVRLGALPTSAGDPPRLLADNHRLRSSGWKPEIPLDKGLASTIEWWRQRLTAKRVEPSAT